MTKKITNLLVLISVLALASCGGSAPTGPNDPVLSSNDSGSVTAMTPSAGGCQAVTGIDLKADDSSRTVLWVQATYQFINYDLGTCPAPTWSSDKEGMVVDRQNPFRAGFPRSARGSVVLTAKALNGVHNSIRLNLSSAGEADGAGSGCRNIVGVNLQILPSDPTKPGVVWIQAKYLQRPPTLDECLFAPTFSANRGGLLIHPRDPFRAGIKKLPEVMTKVFAVAPNGVEGKIVF